MGTAGRERVESDLTPRQHEPSPHGKSKMEPVFDAAEIRHLRQALGLVPTSEILVLGTEGATDPRIYQELVGMMSGAEAAG